MAGKKQRYLRNRKTGVVFNYSNEGAQHPDMVECGKPTSVKQAEKMALTDGEEEKPLAKMNKAELIEKADLLGIAVEESFTKKELIALIEAGPVLETPQTPLMDMSDDELIEFADNLGVVVDINLGREAITKMIVDREAAIAEGL